MQNLFHSKGSHSVSVNMSCLFGDSIKWLSSPKMGGPIPKYYVNMRYVNNIVHFTVLHAEFVIKCRVCFESSLQINLQVLISLTFFKFSVYVVEWFMGFCPVACQKPNNILGSVKLQ